MAFADILSWEAHERYLQQLTSHLRVDPPTGYTRPTLQQILKADRQVFMYLIRIGAQLKRLPDNKLDLDSKLFQALQSYEVGFHLLPLPKAMPQPSATALDPVHGAPGRQLWCKRLLAWCTPSTIQRKRWTGAWQRQIKRQQGHHAEVLAWT